MIDNASAERGCQKKGTKVGEETTNDLGRLLEDSRLLLTLGCLADDA
jgi:hypothetical protein